MEILTGMGEKSLVDEIKTKVKKIDAGRQEYKRQALVNIMFLYGRHHFTLSRNTTSFDLSQKIVWELEAMRRERKIRRTTNYILPLFRSVYSRLLSMKANVHAEPTTSAENDRDAARVSKEVAEEFWQNCNRNNPWINTDYSGMQAILMRLILYKLAIGGGHLVHYFNPKATTFVYDQASKNIFEADVGEAEVRVVSPLNMFRDNFGRFAIERRFISPEQCEYEYGVKPEPVQYDEDTLEAKITRILQGGEFDNDSKEGVYLYQKYCLPTTEYPQGQLIICTDSKIIMQDVLPQEFKMKIPVHDFKYQDLGFNKYGQGIVEQVIDPQQDLNETLTRISHYKRQLTGKVLTPRGAKISEKWDDNVGQILYFNQGFRPTYENGASLPPFIMEDINRIRRDMEDIMNAHDTSMGRTPEQVKSGVGIQALNERDNSQIAPELINFEQRLGFFVESILDICQTRYNERRLLSISGEDMAYEIKSFIGSDLFGQKKIKIKMGSSMPTSLPERQNYIINLLKIGLISPERCKELLEFGDIDGVYKSLDETNTKNDILNIIEGNAQVIADPWQDHTIALKVINDFRKSTKYTKLPPQIRMAIDDLAKQHQDYLLNEQAAAAKMGGALPPAAKPQGAMQ